jgi:multidrug efflux system membrane fusion protein
MDRNAIFVPQRAVMRGADGQAKLLLVSAEGQAEERTVQTGAMQGTEWQITQGLAAGDKVIVEGAAKIPAGTPVTVKKP